MSNPDPSDEVVARLAMIGSVCVHWSHLDLLYAATIWHLLEIDNRVGIIVTVGLDIESRAAMASKLATQMKAPEILRAALDATRKPLADLAGERNLAVHGSYAKQNDGRVSATVHRGKFRGAEEQMCLDRLVALAANIEQIINDLTPTLSDLGIIDLDPPGGHAP